MPRAAVLGSPIAHSLSPVLHRAAYAALGLTDWTYQAVECDEEGLGPLLARLGPQWAGLSLTMPLKRVALDVATSVSDLARAVGAANTMLLTSAGRHADNTDVGGLVDALGGVDTSDPVVIGAGGTAAAALGAIRDLGGAPVAVVVRDPDRAQGLLAAADRLGVTVTLVPWPAVPSAASLVISTVPSGVADLLDLAWHRRPTVCDVVYDPWPTRLAAAALVAGCRVIGGREVLLHQAARQVRLMTGRPAPLEAMRQAIGTS
ncbi:MAG: shikimate dehydrogenase [bacterium]